jgi:hypothetical protein
MKTKMSKAGFFLLVGILLVGVMPVQSTNLYVYTATSSMPQSFSLDVIRKLTFDTSSLVVNKKDGTQASFLFDNLKCFSFKGDLYLGTNIASTSETATTLSVYPNPALTDIVVTGTQTITSLSVYNLQGQKLLQSWPGSEETTVSLTPYPEGVYLLQIIGEAETIIKKIIKK